MKYFIIRDSSASDSRLVVFDSKGKEIFKVSGEISGNNQKLTLSNTSGEQFAIISSSPFAFPHFRVRLGRKRVIFMMTPKGKTPMSIYGADVYFDGTLLTGEYMLKNHAGELVAAQKHGWCKLGECHELEVLDEERTLLSLAVSAAISVYYGIYDKGTAVPT